MDDGGDRACHICSCHCSLCLLDMASQDHQGDWPAPLLQVKELSLSEVLSLGLQCVCWGAARLGAQAFSVHSPVPCPSANLPTSLMSHVFGAKEVCIVLGRLLTWSFTCQSKLADLYSISLPPLPQTVHVTSCTLERHLTDVLIQVLDIVLTSASSSHITLVYQMEEII